jgi:hypothetical protein
MKVSVLSVILLLASVASGCLGTMDARVRISGTLEQSGSAQPQCQIFLVQASEAKAPLTYGEGIRGRFVEWFTVHPWNGPYRAVVKCGDRVALSKEIEYREFKSNEPYDLGSIAP